MVFDLSFYFNIYEYCILIVYTQQKHKLHKSNLDQTALYVYQFTTTTYWYNIWKFNIHNVNAHVFAILRSTSSIILFVEHQ